MKINKKLFKKIVILFSIFLILDYPVLPFILSNLAQKNWCEYSANICFGISVITVLMTSTMWFVIVRGNYLLFYTNYPKKHYTEINADNESILASILKFLYVKKYQANFALDKFLSSGIMIVFCIGILLVFTSLVLEIIKILDLAI